ncbi:hypothetical protein RI129_011359 [Pyrocoelia pectoralis]|uniref:Major facilitator superfamily (MFS) profile domain-containing protein n=1 Tax=Pyrocoelia pectoralis TaxID=417401 RepID=A0AAN7V7S3_9COLE
MIFSIMESLQIWRNARIFQYLAMVTGTLSIVSSGMHYGWSSPSLPILQDPSSTLPVTNDEGSWLAVMPLIGASIGSLIGSVILDRIGRKKAVLLTGIPFFSAWLMVAFARTVPVLLFARFLAGIGDGLAFCAIPMYLNEIADPEIRGFIGSSCAITLILGMLLINIIGSYTSIRSAALVSSIVPVLLMMTFAWMPESPYYFIMQGDEEEARRSLKTLKGTDDVNDELARLSAAIKTQNTDTGKFLDLFTVKSNRKAGLIVMGARTIQQCSGMLAIGFYAHTIFESAGSTFSSSTASIIYFTVQLVLSFISSMIVDRTGRRPLLIISIIGAGIALFIEGFYFYLKMDCPSLNVSNYSYIPIVALIAFVTFFSIGLQTVPMLLLGELFSTNVKAFALSVSDVHFNIVATLVSKFFQAIKDSYGIHIPFFAFAVSCAVGLIFVIFCVPETKGKTLEKIQEELQGKTTKDDSRQVEILKKIVVETIDICNTQK